MPRRIPERLVLELPEWLRSAWTDAPVLTTPEERMRFAIELSRRNIRAGTGGPFAALVVDGETGELIAAGVNLVLSSGLSSMHAEVVALSLAQDALGERNLGATSGRLRLVTTSQPCVMCLGALVWSGIAAIEVAAPTEDVERLAGFDEGPIPADWRRQLADRGIVLEEGLLAAEAAGVLAEFGALVASGDIELYNGGNADAPRPPEP